MVDRFDGPPLMQPYKNGDFVRYSDYAELEAENERLKVETFDAATAHGKTKVERNKVRKDLEQAEILISDLRSVIIHLEAQIAELEAEVERLTKNLYLTRNERDNLSDNVTRLESEALSLTGAVKAGLEQAAAIILAQIDSHPDWTPEQEAELRAHDPVATARSAARVAIKQCHRAILSALEPAAPEGRQEAVAWQHIPGCGTDRESKMVSVSEGVFCDPCIAPLVAALNAAGFATVASCCGHGHRPSVIALRDGRELFIAKDFNEARQIDAIFPIDINGNTRPAEQAVTDEMVGAAEEVFFKTDDHGEPSYDMRAALEAAALKAAMEAGRHD